MKHTTRSMYMHLENNKGEFPLLLILTSWGCSWSCCGAAEGPSSVCTVLDIWGDTLPELVCRKERTGIRSRYTLSFPFSSVLAVPSSLPFWTSWTSYSRREEQYQREIIEFGWPEGLQKHNTVTAMTSCHSYYFWPTAKWIFDCPESMTQNKHSCNKVGGVDLRQKHCKGVSPTSCSFSVDATSSYMSSQVYGSDGGLSVYVLGSEYLLCIKLTNTHKSGYRISKKQTNLS